MPGIAPPAKTYRTATTADYADEFSCCGRAFDFDRYHLRHFEVFSALPFNMTWGQHAGRSPMIARGDQIVANCTAGGAQAADVRPASVVSAERINRSHSPVWLARPSIRPTSTRKDQSRSFRRDERLLRDKASVSAASSKQLVVRPSLDNLARLHDQDHIRCLNGREAMGDDE
jgi:hypothetical protein